MLNVLRCQLTYQGQVVTNAEARFSNSLRPRKPEGSLGRTARDGHLDLTQLLNYASLNARTYRAIARYENRQQSTQDKKGPRSAAVGKILSTTAASLLRTRPGDVCTRRFHNTSGGVPCHPGKVRRIQLPFRLGNAASERSYLPHVYWLSPPCVIYFRSLAFEGEGGVGSMGGGVSEGPVWRH